MKTAIVALAVAALSAPALAREDLSAILAEGAKAELVAEGHKFTEGPVWSPEGFLLFSDIPDDTIYKWSPEMPAGTKAEVFRKPAGHSNGLTLDAQGRLLAAEHAGRISRTEGAEVKTVADKFDGKALSSPNDLVARPDGSVWFTDPTYGLNPRLGPGGNRKKETEFNGVYRVGPDGSVSVIAKDLSQPNGLAFSTDGKTLYVADTVGGVIRAFDVAADGAASNPRTFAEVKADNGRSAGPDGVKISAAGHILCAARGGVWVWDNSGKLLGRIEIPKGPSNLCFGGAEFKTLFVTAGTDVYRVELKVSGAK